MAGVSCYVLNPAEAALPEAYFPAALDDSMAVYKAVVAKADPKRVGLISTSAGGALVLEMVLRAKQTSQVAAPHMCHVLNPKALVHECGPQHPTVQDELSLQTARAPNKR